MRYLESQQMNELCHELAVALFDQYREPIPPFALHDEHKLEAILANPQQTFAGKDLYPTLHDKAAILYYGIIKGHPFDNGNKRIATASLIVFLAINGQWLDVPARQLEHMAISVAASQAEQKEKHLKKLQRWIKKNAITLPNA